MALPAANTAWPPAPFDTALADIGVHDAWYVGDPTALASIYQRTGGASQVRPSQRAGGLVGTVARFFWGRPQTAGQTTTRLHVPVAADIATTSADLLFSEPPRILLPRTEDTGADGKTVVTDHPAQERLEEIVNNAFVHSAFLEAAELGSALGGSYLRVAWDSDVAQHPILSAFGADRAIPEFTYGRLRAVTFWTVVKDTGSTVLRHLERHEKGRILHGLYEGTSTSLGRLVPLTDSAATTGLAELVDADSAIVTGADRLTAVYIPNMLPQRRWRKESGLAPLGRSDFDGIEGIFDAIDEVYSSWMRDIRLAKARVFIDSMALTNMGAGAGAEFDVEQELFTAAGDGVGAAKDGSAITPYQFQIRWEEHQRTIQDLTRAALRASGYSPASFGDDSVSVQETATQVKSKQQLSERTRDKKIRYWKAALSELAVTMLQVDAHVFSRALAAIDGLPEVRFPEQTQQDLSEMAGTIEALDRANAISTVLKVRMAHPDWDADKVDEEVARIKDDATFGDPFAERGTDVVDGEDALADRADALGSLVRSGATQESAATVAGLDGLKFTGERPITTRPVNSDE